MTTKIPTTPKKFPNVWYKQQEMILKKWGEIGSSYRYMHDRAYIKYNEKNMKFALPVIIISTITGTANFAQGTFPADAQPYVPLFIGLLNLSAGLITTISQFLRVSELLEGHRAASIAYSKFSRNISVELSLPVKERTCSGREFIQNCRTELDRLIEQSPNIPLEIVKQFGTKFESDNFIKPEILEISAVQIYNDTEEESRKNQEAEKKRQAQETEIFNKIQAREKKLREDNESRMINIISEIDKINKKREDEFLKKLELKEKTRNEATALNAVANNMDNLVQSLQKNASRIISDIDNEVKIEIQDEDTTQNDTTQNDTTQNDTTQNDITQNNTEIIADVLDEIATNIESNN